MTADHESSYYEIALTNRQVMTIFVVLLTCLVAAFLSGVWIGRRDGAEGVLAAVGDEPPAQQASAQLTELNFFSDAPPLKGREEPRRPAAPPPEPRQTEADERDGGDSGPAARDEAGAGSGPSARPAPAPPPPAPPPAEPGEGAAAEGPVIQVFSTPDMGQARRLVQRLGAGGYPVFLLQESLKGQTMYRVRVGPFSEEDEARKTAEKLRREYRLETWITSQRPG